MARIHQKKFIAEVTFIAATIVAAMTIFFSSNVLAEEIVVGAMHDRSGSHALYGTEMDDAVKFAVEEINSAGGLLGKKIKLIAYDTQSNMQVYGQYATRLATREKASVVFGGVSSASREVIRPIFDRYGVLYFYNTFYEGGVCDKNTFVCGETPAQMIGPALSYVLERFKSKRLYSMWADYNYGHICSTWLENFVKKQGAELVAKDFYPLDVTDFSSVITKIQEAKPDLVISGLVAGNHMGFYRQWAAAGMNGKIPMHALVLGPWENRSLQPKETEGIITSYHYFENIDSPKNKAFVTKWRAKFGKNYPEIGTLAVTTYDGVMLWKLAVQKAGTVERKAVIKALESGIGFEGPGGYVKMHPESHHMIMSIMTTELVNGKFKVVGKLENVMPSDTAALCDLIAKPDQATQYQP